ncbi:HopJ type III effector protein [Salinibius halmophilus]|uniref:HopJ type III effector protein n=1 Tax=Salinibius halmophilus TaxID=1853216 RepID=UPI000E65EB84|nr:HopJ type III effector protein [Salinibius halmophilus]
MDLNVFIDRLNQSPELVEFEDVMAFIERHYDYQPTAFENGDVVNEAGQNEGSCKILAMAKHMGFTQAQTLHCFGRFYRQDVLQNPDSSDHQNIRQFMLHGWGGVKFSGQPLVRKAAA